MPPSDESTSDSQSRPRSSWPAMATPVLTGLLGLFGAAIGASLQSRGNVDLERERLRSQLILKAIETGNPHLAAVNLKFLVDVGLVIDTSGSWWTTSTSPTARRRSQRRPLHQTRRRRLRRLSYHCPREHRWRSPCICRIQRGLPIGGGVPLI